MCGGHDYGLGIFDITYKEFLFDTFWSTQYTYTLPMVHTEHSRGVLLYRCAVWRRLGATPTGLGCLGASTGQIADGQWQLGLYSVL